MQIVSTKGEKIAVGPYSQAIVANGFVFCSGQIAQDMVTGEVKKGSVKEQTYLALENLKSVVETAGSDMNHIVKCNIYMSDLADFDQMNMAYAEVFDGHRPARLTVQVARLYGEMDIEIDAIAELP